MPRKPTPAATTEIVSYKGFNSALQCRGFQFEEGKSYDQSGDIVACQNGFHACEYPLDILGYYSAAGSRFAIVRQSGAIARHEDDTKIASAHITIDAEIHIPELIQRAVDYVFSRAKKTGRKHTKKKGGSAANVGTRGAASATGYSGAASATGYSGAASATGTRGKVQGVDGCALFLIYRDPNNGYILHAWAGIVGRDGIKPLVWYTLNEHGKPVETA